MFLLFSLRPYAFVGSSRKLSKQSSEDKMRADRIRMKLPAVDGAQGDHNPTTMCVVMHVCILLVHIRTKWHRHDADPPQ